MRTLLLLVMTAMLPMSAFAQDEALRTSGKIRNPSAPLTSLHAEELIPILVQLGLQYEGATLPGGEKVLLATAPSGQRFQVAPTACDAEGRCRGVHLSSLFYTSAERRTVSAFNDRYAFVSAGISRDGMAYLSRYELADFGLPRGNLGVSIEVFLETAELFAEHLADSPKGLKQPPQATDLAANGLNTQTRLKALGGSFLSNSITSMGPVVPHSHAISFEQTNDIVETFARAEALYPGRIVNRIED